MRPHKQRHQPGSHHSPAMTDSLCPSCERFIGPAPVCPYCDCDARRAPVLRLLKITALTLSVGGLLILWAAAALSEPRRVDLNDLSPLMNRARVRCQGWVTREAYVSQENGVTNYLSFPLGNGTNTLRVYAEGPVARALSGAGRAPAKGQHLRVDGLLRTTREAGPRLRIESPDALLNLQETGTCTR